MHQVDNREFICPCSGSDDDMRNIIMANDFDEKTGQIPFKGPLDELLEGVTDEKEKGPLSRAWHVLGGLTSKECLSPKASSELNRIFRQGYAHDDDECMSDEDLHMVAAAGTQGVVPDGQDTVPPFIGLAGPNCGGEEIIGGDGDDILRGGEGDDILDGGEGRDFMLGCAGDDYMDGGAGNDRMAGGEGEDTLVGGAGNDIMAGGTGGDVFVFDTSSGNDTIVDYNPLEDSLVFQGIESEEVSMEYKDGNTIITFGETTITVLGVNLNEQEPGPGGSFM